MRVVSDRNTPGLPGKNKSKQAKKDAKVADAINSGDDEAEGEGLISGSGTEGDDADLRPRPKPRPKPRPTRRRALVAEGNDGDDEDVFGPVSSPKLASPDRQSSRNLRSRHDDVVHDNSEPPEHEVNLDVFQVGPQDTVNGLRSPPQTSPKKRRREENEPKLSAGHKNNGPSPGRASSPAPSHISVADVKNRRKRVRR